MNLAKSVPNILQLFMTPVNQVLILFDVYYFGGNYVYGI